MTDWTKQEQLVVGVYLAPKRGAKARGGAPLIDTFVLDPKVKARKRWDDVKAAVKAEVEARGYELRTVSIIAEQKSDIHVSAYVHDRGQGMNALLQRSKPVRRDGPHGGPLGRHVKKKTAQTIARNRGR